MKLTKIQFNKIGFWLGIFIFFCINLLPYESTINTNALAVLSVLILMISWWIFNSIHIYVTSLIPLIVIPILTNQSFEDIAAPYASPIIFLFLGGFILAIAIESCNLHKRFAYFMISKFGRNDSSILASFMLVSYLMSMWIINTAVAMLLLPIAIQVCKDLEAKNSKFEILLLLSIAYSASIGGMSTIIGTAPNVFFVGFMYENFDIQISFLEWMTVALPISAIILFLSFFIFFYLIKKNKNIDQAKSQNISLKKLPTMSGDEVKVLLVFIVTIAAWVFRGYLNQLNFLSNLTDSGIAITSAFLFFLIPSSNKKNNLLQWKHLKQLPWGLLLLFGGGLALAKAIMISGLGDWLGTQLTFLNNLSVFYIIFILIFATVFLTEVISNTALTISFLPIIGVIAVDMGLSINIIGMAVVMAASCAFMLPIATPPNAVIFATEKIKVMDMVKVGFIMNIFTIFFITLIFYIMM